MCVVMPVIPICSLCSEAEGSGQGSWDHSVVILQNDQSTQIEFLPDLSMWRGTSTMALTCYSGLESPHSSPRAPVVS